MEFTPLTDVRVFQRNSPESKLLYRNGLILGRGKTVKLSEPQAMDYDHKIQRARSFMVEDREYWVLEDEIELHRSN